MGIVLKNSTNTRKTTARFTKYLASYIPLLLLYFPLGHAADSSSEEKEFALAYGDEEMLSIATGANQPVARAPAVATVITATQIKEIGATDLDQILETIPGLHVARSARAYDPIYVIRGIYSETNQQVLILINGFPITNIFLGNRNDVWGGMPVKDIVRIEVVRGPGSAVYGADAFSGVINIITKDADDIDGTEIGGRVGSFDSKDVWLLHGREYGGIKTAFSIEYGATDGQRETITADAETGLDTLFGTSASLAPGPVNLGRKYLDTRLDLGLQNWRLRLGYQGRRNVGTGAGVAQALDPAGDTESDRFNADLSYRLTTIQNWDTTVELSYFNTSARANLVLFPAGAFGGAFPDGVIGNPDVYERHARAGISSFYTGWHEHRLRLGAGYNQSDLYRVNESRNYTFAPGGIPVPLGSVIDVSDSAAFVREELRQITYAFVQDEWSFARDWNLTAGVRHDHYSDFGDTTNPRAAVVWQTDYNLTTKLLYGRAFRAPSFAELYNINNPVVLGNSQLKPETIDTLELAFDYQISEQMRAGLNLFNYHMRDIIRFVTDPAPATTITAQNSGNQKGHGLEFELNWLPMKTLRLIGNYAFQRSEDQRTQADPGNAPHHQAYLRANWQALSNWSINPQVKWISERRRAAGDTRPNLEGYTLVDLTLRHSPALHDGKLEFAGSVRNLFDANAYEPSLSPGLIPNDFPLAGRNFYLEATYKL